LDWKVRNHAQGFTFQTVEEIPAQVASVCNAVLDDLGVDFCALDVIHHKPTDLALVLEGNTAPGLEDGRLVVYGNYLKTRYEEFKNNAV
jgi:glutathione synthase/RimK-type ligase-like ATP-grasp enzyme